MLCVGQGPYRRPGVIAKLLEREAEASPTSVSGCCVVWGPTYHLAVVLESHTAVARLTQVSGEEGGLGQWCWACLGCSAGWGALGATQMLSWGAFLAGVLALLSVVLTGGAMLCLWCSHIPERVLEAVYPVVSLPSACRVAESCEAGAFVHQPWGGNANLGCFRIGQTPYALLPWGPHFGSQE